MEQSSDAETQLLAALLSLQFLIQEQLATTDELKAVTRELEALLMEMAGRDQRHIIVVDVSFQQTDTTPSEAPEKRADSPPQSLSQLKREADRTLRISRDAVREARTLRLRAAQFRATLGKRGTQR